MESLGKLSDIEMARRSLQEEAKAVRDYKTRIRKATDDSLKKTLKHNMEEEKEHISMLIKWLRGLGIEIEVIE